MSTPDIVLIDTPKLRCEIKGGKPLINGKPAADCWKKHDITPDTGTYLNLAFSSRCGCLVGVVAVEALGVDGARAAIGRVSMVTTGVAEEIHVPRVILRGIESGFEDYTNGPRDGDDEGAWDRARKFGALVRKQVGFEECKF